MSGIKKKLEILNKNIELNKLIYEIKTFLKKCTDPFDYATYTIHEFPEDKLKIFKIEYGIKNPTTKFFVVIKGDSNNLQILDHVPTDYASLAQTFLISETMFLPRILNAKLFHNKLWKFIENTVKSLEKQ